MMIIIIIIFIPVASAELATCVSELDSVLLCASSNLLDCFLWLSLDYKRVKRA